MEPDRTKGQSTDGSTDAILAEVKNRVDEASEAWDENHRLAIEDIEFRDGDQWPSHIQRKRMRQKKPVLTFNRMEQFIDQIVGDQRENRPAIAVYPTSADNEKVPSAMAGQRAYTRAEVMQGIIRNIEFQSHAEHAYDTAFDNATGNGFGWFRIVTEYADDATFDLDIRIKRVRNPFAVILDPAHEEVTGEDAMYGFVSRWVRQDEYQRMFPQAQIGGAELWASANGTDYEHWWSDNSTRVAEYFRKVPEKRLIVLGTDGGIYDLGVTDEERQAGSERLQVEGVSFARHREVDSHKVEWRLMSAAEVLEGPIPFPSKYIPLIPVFGKELVRNGRTIYRSAIRHSKDAQRSYNYWQTALTEQVALQGKSPWVGDFKLFDQFKNIWKSANTEDHAYLPVDTQDGTRALPQRQPPPTIPSGALALIEQADYNLRATIGIEKSGLGQESNEKSGRAIMARQREGDVGTYSFHDNLNRAIEHAGRVLLDMIPRVYDTQRVVRLRKPDDSGDYVEINKVDETGRKLYDLGTARYDVVVKSGPSHTTQRQMVVDTLLPLIQAVPALGELSLDILAQNMDWPGADELHKRIRTFLIQKGMVKPEEDEEQPEPKEPTPEEQADLADAEAKMAKAEADMAQAKADMATALHDIQQLQAQIEGMNIEALVTAGVEQALTQIIGSMDQKGGQSA